MKTLLLLAMCWLTHSLRHRLKQEAGDKKQEEGDKLDEHYVE